MTLKSAIAVWIQCNPGQIPIFGRGTPDGFPSFVPRRCADIPQSRTPPRRTRQASDPRRRRARRRGLQYSVSFDSSIDGGTAHTE